MLAGIVATASPKIMKGHHLLSIREHKIAVNDCLRLLPVQIHPIEVATLLVLGVCTFAILLGTKRGEKAENIRKSRL